MLQSHIYKSIFSIMEIGVECQKTRAVNLSKDGNKDQGSSSLTSFSLPSLDTLFPRK